MSTTDRCQGHSAPVALDHTTCRQCHLLYKQWELDGDNLCQGCCDMLSRPNLTLASFWGGEWVQWEVHVGAGVQFVGCDCATIGCRGEIDNIMVDGFQAEYEGEWLRLSPAPNPISVAVALQSLAAAAAARKGGGG